MAQVVIIKLTPAVEHVGRDPLIPETTAMRFPLIVF